MKSNTINDFNIGYYKNSKFNSPKKCIYKIKEYYFL
jgi:hypothetical protein